MSMTLDKQDKHHLNHLHWCLNLTDSAPSHRSSERCFHHDRMPKLDRRVPRARPRSKIRF